MENKISFEKTFGEGKDEERKIRKSINLGEGIINIYEPTNEQVNEIIKFYDEYFKDEKNKKEGTIDFKQILFYLIPLLTNLSYSSLDNELYIIGLIQNPPLYLRLVIAQLQQILNEVNYVRIEEAKGQMKQIETMLTQSEIINNIPDNVINILDNKESLMNEKTAANIKRLTEVNERLNKKQETPKEKEIRELKEKLQKLETGEDIE